MKAKVKSENQKVLKLFFWLLAFFTKKHKTFVRKTSPVLSFNF